MPNSTTNYGFNLPIVNSAVDEDLWGDQLNSNWGDIDGLLNLRQQNYAYAGFEISNALVVDLGEKTFDLGTDSGALAVDYTDGHYQHVVLDGNVSSLVISNPPASGTTGFMTLEITQDGGGGNTIDLTGGTYRSTGDVILTSTGGAIDKLRLETRNGGTTWDIGFNANFVVLT